MIIQLNPPLPCRTPKGPALAHFMINEGPESDLKWICFQENTGECWTWRNRDFRADKNITEGRDHISPFYDPDSVSLKNKNPSVCDECGEWKDECICEDTNYESMYHEKCEELSEVSEDIDDYRKENSILNEKYKISIDLIHFIINLYNNDQILPEKRSDIREVLINTKVVKDTYDGRLCLIKEE